MSMLSLSTLLLMSVMLCRLSTPSMLPKALQSAYPRVLTLACLCWGLLSGFQQACCSQVLRLELGRANLNLAGPTVR